MARDPDGKPIETRGRRSISQRSRDLSERFDSLGAFLDGAPKMLELAATGAFLTSMIYFMRPTIRVVSRTDPIGPRFKGVLIERIEFRYPDLPIARNVALLIALVVAPGTEGIGSFLVPAGTALVFAEFIKKMFPNPVAVEGFLTVGWPFNATLGAEHSNDFIPYTQILTDAGPLFPQEGAPFGNVPPGWDATLFVYAKYVIPRWIRAIMVAAFFYILIRFIRNIGRS